MILKTQNWLDKMIAKVRVCVRNSCTPSPLRYALIKNPFGSGTTM
jgi:hypothetical protein